MREEKRREMRNQKKAVSWLVWGVGDVQQGDVSTYIGRSYKDTRIHVYTQGHT